MRELARRAKVSHNAPYRHFPDREALLAELAAEGFDLFRRELDAAEQLGGLRARGEAYLRFALKHPQRFRLMFGGGLSLAKYPSLAERAASAFGGLNDAMAKHAGQPAPHAALAAWALVHGLANLLLDDRIAAARVGGDVDQFVREVLGAVRFAVGKPQPA